MGVRGGVVGLHVSSMNASIEREKSVGGFALGEKGGDGVCDW